MTGGRLCAVSRPMYWPLAVPTFTVLDKLKVGWWLLKETHWSQGEWVRAYEKTWEQHTGAPRAIMVSSGSAANHLLAYRRRWELEKTGEWPKKNRVIFPVVNWISAVSPWILLGFEPVFIDVSYNLSSSSDQVAKALHEHENVAAVFYTTLLGVPGNLSLIRKLCRQHGVPLLLDNCEATFSMAPSRDWPSQGLTSINNLVSCSTSFYFSHHTSGNQEGGMIFCQTQPEADFYRMARNHGMTRGMLESYRNPEVDPRFDFRLLGSNHRSTNLLAFMASLDFERAFAFCRERIRIALEFAHALDDRKYEDCHRRLNFGVPLALPIVCRDESQLKKVKALLDKRRVEHRPIVGGNLLRQTAFRQYGNPAHFPRAEHIHRGGLYIGLHSKITMKMALALAEELNRQ